MFNFFNPKRRNKMEKTKKKKKFKLNDWDKILIGFAVCLAIVGGIYIGSFYYQHKIREDIFINPLIQIIEHEINNSNLSKNAICKDYMLYYNKTFSEKYPEIDARPIRYIDLCNNLTLCNYYHTIMFLSGYGAEAILDQKSYVAIRFKKIEKIIIENEK